jgi:plasmid stability protein
MKRTTIYLDPELELLLKLEARRSKKPVAKIIREVLRKGITPKRPRSRYAGAFDSGHTTDAERFEEVLEELGFGDPENS